MKNEIGNFTVVHTNDLIDAVARSNPTGPTWVNSAPPMILVPVELWTAMTAAAVETARAQDLARSPGLNQATGESVARLVHAAVGLGNPEAPPPMVGTEDVEHATRRVLRNRAALAEWSDRSWKRVGQISTQIGIEHPPTTTLDGATQAIVDELGKLNTTDHDLAVAVSRLLQALGRRSMAAACTIENLTAATHEAETNHTREVPGSPGADIRAAVEDLAATARVESTASTVTVVGRVKGKLIALANTANTLKTQRDALAGPTTGRMSAREPNITNPPRGDDEAAHVSAADPYPVAGYCVRRWPEAVASWEAYAQWVDMPAASRPPLAVASAAWDWLDSKHAAEGLAFALPRPHMTTADHIAAAFPHAVVTERLGSWRPYTDWVDGLATDTSHEAHTVAHDAWSDLQVTWIDLGGSARRFLSLFPGPLLPTVVSPAGPTAEPL